MENIKERNYLFDNIKAIMIFLMVFAHFLEYIPSFKAEVMDVCIYTFHMPLFVFISGYFSKNVDKCRKKAFMSCMVPCLIFNTLYVLIYNALNGFTLKIFPMFPEYLFWFLFSLFFWRICLKDLIKIKFVLPLVFLVSLYAGCFREIGRFLSFSRILTFLPYFLMGYFCDMRTIEKIRKIPKLFSVIALAVVFSGVVYLHKIELFPRFVFLGGNSYVDLQYSNLKGIAVRIFAYCLSCFVSVLIISLVSEKKSFYSHIGKNTITVYVLDAFIMIPVMTYSKYLNINIYVQIAVYFALAVIFVFAAGNDKTVSVYNKFMLWIEKTFVSADKKAAKKTV